MFKIKIHVHFFTKWSRPIATGNSDIKQQWKECQTCGKVQFRTIKDGNKSEIDTVNEALDSVGG